MNFLILHQKALQFRCIVEFLIANNHSVTFASEYGSDWTPSDNSFISNYRHISVSIDEKPSSSISSIHRAGHFRKIFLKLRKDGFKPDIILSHSGWGAGLYSLDIFPESKLISYLEWYYSCASLLPIYSSKGNHHLVSYDKASKHQPLLSLTLNSELLAAHTIVSPTKWQAEYLPSLLRSKLVICHEGIPDLPFHSNPPPILHSGQKINITYATRGFEPLRGFTPLSRHVYISSKFTLV